MSERIDQGVDYAGSGRLSAIGAGRITHLAASETGWPGAFIESRLSSGPDEGCYVYYAEGVTGGPAPTRGPDGRRRPSDRVDHPRLFERDI